jgi:hypothetical protein
MRNNDPYYLGNDTELPAKLVVKTTSKSIEQSLHWDANMYDYLDAFYTAMIGIGFHPESVINGMEEFVQIHKEDDETV